MKNLIFIAILAVSNSLYSQRVDIAVIGNWMKAIDASDISDAGNDYASAYTSNIDQTKITIIPKNYNKTNIVYIHKEDIAWNAALTLKIRRTSGGTYVYTNINDGLIFQTITNNDAYFFNCQGPYVDVNLQYQITGISVLLPVQSYSTTVMFTVLQQ
jgi:hypothetical protein